MRHWNSRIAQSGVSERGRRGRGPAPWYTEQAAIIHRKLGQHDCRGEVASYLERRKPRRAAWQAVADSRGVIASFSTMDTSVIM
jgi:hypothetical protein